MIKFRVWSKIERAYIKTDLLFDGGGDILININNIWEELSDNYVIEQFTGQVDKNKVEVYAGDVFSVDGGKRICAVEWFEPQSCFDTKLIEVIDYDTPFLGLPNSAWKYRCEIIRSIHDKDKV